MPESKWQAVHDLLGHMERDEDLMLAWALAVYGDVRSERGRQAIRDIKRKDLRKLMKAVAKRAGTDG